jgi:hypothetical protein
LEQGIYSLIVCFVFFLFIIVVQPNLKHERQLRANLLKQFKHLGSASLFAHVEDSVPVGLATQEFFPYVFLSLAVAQAGPAK